MMLLLHIMRRVVRINNDLTSSCGQAAGPSVCTKQFSAPRSGNRFLKRIDHHKFQSIGSRPLAFKKSFVLEKWRQPKKP
jgi:hypothetical protein